MHLVVVEDVLVTPYVECCLNPINNDGDNFLTICNLIMKTLVIFDFTKNADLQYWNVVDDTVMGGVSAGKVSVDAEGNGIFQGHVSLENNGGFSSLKYNAGNTKLTGFSKFVIALKGDGKAYQLRVKTNSSQYYSYTATFTTNNNWQTIEIPFILWFLPSGAENLTWPTSLANIWKKLAF